MLPGFKTKPWLLLNPVSMTISASGSSSSLPMRYISLMISTPCANALATRRAPVCISRIGFAEMRRNRVAAEITRRRTGWGMSGNRRLSPLRKITSPRPGLCPSIPEASPRAGHSTTTTPKAPAGICWPVSVWMAALVIGQPRFTPASPAAGRQQTRKADATRAALSEMNGMSWIDTGSSPLMHVCVVAPGQECRGSAASKLSGPINEPGCVIPNVRDRFFEHFRRDTRTVDSYK